MQKLINLLIKMKKLLFGLASLLFIITSCNGQPGDKETEVMLETDMGNIRIKLYNDTPLHRDNFIKNVKEGNYNNTTWHRMIQTGEQPVKTDINGDTIASDSSKWIPAEIRYPKYFHKRGMIGAAREGDEVNPNRNSDPTQFYIVTGRTYQEEGLRELNAAREQQAVTRLYDKKMTAHAQELENMRKARNRDGVSDLLEKLLDEARYDISENPPTPFNEEQSREYRTSGGAPWLDGEYTIFGEVVEGMKTVLAIERVKTDTNKRPVSDVKILKAYIIEK